MCTRRKEYRCTHHGQHDPYINSHSVALCNLDCWDGLSDRFCCFCGEPYCCVPSAGKHEPCRNCKADRASEEICALDHACANGCRRRFCKHDRDPNVEYIVPLTQEQKLELPRKLRNHCKVCLEKAAKTNRRLKIMLDRALAH